MMKFEQYDADDFIGAALSPCDVHDMPSDAGVSSAAMRHVLSSPMIFRRTSSATSVSSYSSSGPTTPTEEVAPATITPDMLYLSHGGADEYSTIDLKSCHDTYSPESLRSTPVSSPVKSEFFDTPCTNILMTPATESYFSPFYSPSPMTFHSATAASFALQKIASETPSPPATPPPMSRSVSTASTLSGFSFASPPSAEDMSPTSSQSSSSFSSPTSLTSALLKDRSISISSSADKPHKCEKCPKRFKRLEHLRRHCRTHTDERPFICDVDSCRRKFSRSDNLRAHRRTHMKRGGRNDYIEGLGDLGN